MNKKVYLVIGNGYDYDYENQPQWVVTGYSDLNKAEEHRDLCNNWLMLHHKHNNSYEYETKEVPNPYDKDFHISNDYTYKYSVEEVELVDHLNTYLGDS